MEQTKEYSEKYDRERYERQREEHIERAKAWYLKHKEEILMRKKERRARLKAQRDALRPIVKGLRDNIRYAPEGKLYALTIYNCNGRIVCRYEMKDQKRAKDLLARYDAKFNYRIDKIA